MRIHGQSVPVKKAGKIRTTIRNILQSWMPAQIELRFTKRPEKNDEIIGPNSLG